MGEWDAEHLENRDGEIMPYIHIANIACGGHAGNPTILRETIALALSQDVKVGAHPGYVDRENFGRKYIDLSESELTNLWHQQIGLFMKIADELGAEMYHVKPHGALYHACNHQEKEANSLLKFFKELDKKVFLFVFPGSLLEKEALKNGIPILRESFIDRQYTDDLRLQSRSITGALISDIHTASAQYLALQKNTIITDSGALHPYSTNTACIHGDNPNAVEILKAIATQKKHPLSITCMNESSVLIQWPEKIDEDILEDIIQLKNILVNRYSDRLVNHTSAYNSLLLSFDKSVDNTILHEIDIIYNQQEKKEIEYKTWEIPVCYEDEYAIDMSSFVEKGMTKEEVIDLHTKATYRVYMIGFLPGFIYLGGLPEALHFDRKDTPSLHIPARSVAIGGEQTGIYPIKSPGGWHVIGNVPFRLFDLDKDIPTPIQQGDKIRFYAVEKEVYEQLATV